VYVLSTQYMNNWVVSEARSEDGTTRVLCDLHGFISRGSTSYKRINFWLKVQRKIPGSSQTKRSTLKELMTT
jgi:hypothetical protein